MAFRTATEHHSDAQQPRAECSADDAMLAHGAAHCPSKTHQPSRKLLHALLSPEAARANAAVRADTSPGKLPVKVLAVDDKRRQPCFPSPPCSSEMVTEVVVQERQGSGQPGPEPAVRHHLHGYPDARHGWHQRHPGDPASLPQHRDPHRRGHRPCHPRRAGAADPPGHGRLPVQAHRRGDAGAAHHRLRPQAPPEPRGSTDRLGPAVRCRRRAKRHAKKRCWTMLLASFDEVGAHADERADGRSGG